jgi:CRISPR-associated protein Cmr2
MDEKWQEWQSTLQLLLDYSQDQEPSPELTTLLDRNPTVVLLSADVDRIQDYVFESARLPEIRGASMLVEEINRQAAEEDLGQSVIYKGGGSLLAILPDLDTAEKKKVNIERRFPQATGLVTTTCVFHQTTVYELLYGYKAAEVTPGDLWELRDSNHLSDWDRITAAFDQDRSVKKEDFIDAVQQQFRGKRHFGQMVEIMSVLLRCQKDQGRVPLGYEALPQAMRCRSCGQRPAILVGRYADTPDPWPLCDPCWHKFENRTKRSNFWLEEKAVPFFRTYTNYFENSSETEIESANDLTDIGQACRSRRGYVAFIYADGDQIGQYMSSQQTPGTYKKASENLIEATEKAVYHSLAQFLRPMKITRKNDESGEDEDVWVHPFEIITIGGDDAILVVPADMALPIAVSISRYFKQQLDLSMSVGVVIASAHTPVRSLRDIAKQLLKSAKKRAKGTSSSIEKEGGLDFLVLSSQSMLRRNLEDLRNTYPIYLPGEGKLSRLRLTGAPYSISEVVILLGLLSQMRRRNFPTSQLQQLAAALRQGREGGSLYFLYQQARLRGKSYGDVLKAIQDEWGFDDKRDPVPWQTMEIDPGDSNPGPRYISILPDLADLFSFVPTNAETFQRWHTLIPEVAHANSD